MALFFNFPLTYETAAENATTEQTSSIGVDVSVPTTSGGSWPREAGNGDGTSRTSHAVMKMTGLYRSLWALLFLLCWLAK